MELTAPFATHFPLTQGTQHNTHARAARTQLTSSSIQCAASMKRIARSRSKTRCTAVLRSDGHARLGTRQLGMTMSLQQLSNLSGDTSGHFERDLEWGDGVNPGSVGAWNRISTAPEVIARVKGSRGGVQHTTNFNLTLPNGRDRYNRLKDLSKARRYHQHPPHNLLKFIVLVHQAGEPYGYLAQVVHVRDNGDLKVVRIHDRCGLVVEPGACKALECFQWSMVPGWTVPGWTEPV